MASRNYLAEFNEKITRQFIELLEKFDTPGWKKPWVGLGSTAYNPVSGKSYTGGNFTALFISEMLSSPTPVGWATFNQWKSIGFSVKKGEKGYSLIRPIVREVVEGGETVRKNIFWGAFTVFSSEQVHDENMNKYVPKVEVPLLEAERDEKCEAFANALQSVRPWESVEGSDRAFYSRATDTISIPSFSQFNSARDYYSTLFHEMIHATMKPLERDLPRPQEELVAELGSVILGSVLGLDFADPMQHVSYIASWLTAAEADPTFLLTTSGFASKACAWLLSHGGDV